MHVYNQLANVPPGTANTGATPAAQYPSKYFFSLL
jgi:hypothetical protein